MNSYEEKKQKRIDRYKDLASKNDHKSKAAYERSQEIASHIPFGQPIMVGHHSEKRHRRDISKIDSAMHTSVDAQSKAEYYRSKAQAAETSNAISSDDPDALEKIQERINVLESRQEVMKQANKIIKKGLIESETIAELEKLGISNAKKLKELVSGDFCNRIGFPRFELTNNNANIRRLKIRLKGEIRKSRQETTEKTIGDVRVVDNIDANRLQMFFSDKPADEIRSRLKSGGFRWSPSNGCWQSYRNRSSQYVSEEIIKLLNK